MGRIANRLALSGAISVVTLMSAFALAPASATTLTTYTLNVDGCSGGCGVNGQGSTNNDFGTIQLSDDGMGDVTVTETLTGTEFVNSAGKEALAFDLTALPGLMITDISAGFSQGLGGPFHMPPFGNGSEFEFAIHCNACGNGGSNPDPGPLSFVVSATGLTAADFVANGNSFYFASDVIGTTTGKTGDVGAYGTPTIVRTPEAPTGAFLIGGMALLTLTAVRRRRGAKA